MTKIVLYWDGIIANKELAQIHAPTLQKLLDGNYKEANLDLKKLPHHRIYSVRVNLADRLLLTTVVKDKRSYLLLLGEVTNHDYHKSPFLKPAVLSAFLEKNAPLITEKALVSEDDFEVYTAPLLSQKEIESSLTNSNKPLETMGWTYHNANFIQFNDSQQRALQTNLPALISGVAGSGKSCVAFSLLANGRGKRLYLAQSQELINHMRQLWDAHPSNQFSTSEVVFLSYYELLLQLDPGLARYAVVGEEAFSKWIEIYMKSFLRREKNTTSKKSSLANNEQSHFFAKKAHFYQEFRIISACNKDAYLQLGQTQSLFQEEVHRLWLFNAYLAYQKHLDTNQELDPAFFQFSAQNHYDLVVVDEAQDLSPCQLKQLFHLANQGAIAYCIDSHQSLHDSQSKRPFLLSLMPQQTKLPMACVELPGSYRCKPKIIKFANRLLSLKFALTGGLADKKEPSSICAVENDSDGSVEWLNDLNEETIKLLQKAAESSQLVVITLPQYKNKAKQLFNTPLVFTVDEFKGLEYDTIIAYQLFDGDEFEEASLKFAQYLDNKSDSPKAIHRPKKNTGDERFSPLINHVYTAITRACSRLIFIQTEAYAKRALFQFLKDGLSNEVQSVVFEAEQLTLSWEDEANKLLRLNKIEQARAIFRDKLGKSDCELNVICERQDISPKSSQRKQAKQPATIKKSEQSKTPPINPIKMTQQQPKAEINQPFTKAEKEIQYLRGLLQNFSENNLVRFFNSKNYERLLFHTPLCERQTLFLVILTNTQYLVSFRDFFETKVELFTKVFTSAAVCKPFAIPGHALENSSVLYWMAQLPNANWIKERIKNSPSVLEGISVEALCRSPSSSFGNGILENTSALYFLSGSLDGHAFLVQLLTHNPKIASGISDKAWMLKPKLCTRAPLTELKHSKYSEQVFSQLPDYIKMFAHYIERLKDTDLDLLERIITKFDEDSLMELFLHDCFEFLLFYPLTSKKFTIFKAVMTNTDEAKQFIHFLSKNQSFLNKFSPKALCTDYTVAGGEDCNFPLYLLFSTEGGYLFVNTFPVLLKGISGEAWCRPCSTKEKGADNISPFYLLAVFSQFGDGALLEYLVKENNATLQGITLEGLYRGLQTQMQEHENTSAFARFCNYEKGIWFLQRLFRVNQPLIEGVNQDLLCRVTNNCNFGAVSPLFCLAGFEQGQQLLCYLFRNRPELGQSIPLESWLLTPSHTFDGHALAMVVHGPFKESILKFLSAEVKEVANHLKIVDGDSDNLYSPVSQQGFFSNYKDVASEELITDELRVFTTKKG